MARAANGQHHPTLGDSQFSLAELMRVMTVIAVACAAGMGWIAAAIWMVLLLYAYRGARHLYFAFQRHRPTERKMFFRDFRSRCMKIVIGLALASFAGSYFAYDVISEFKDQLFNDILNHYALDKLRW